MRGKHSSEIMCITVGRMEEGQGQHQEMEKSWLGISYVSNTSRADVILLFAGPAILQYCLFFTLKLIT